MNFNTRGIVLRTVKYGETSVIVSIFTELFGQQSYIVNGVRASSRKAGTRANLFQPGALLDLVVYHHDQKNLQRIKEYNWAVLYEHLFFDVFKSCVCTYMVELLQKCLKQPEPSPELFYFMEDVMENLDQANPAVVANFPLFFALHLANFFGFRIPDEYSEAQPVLDLREGIFVSAAPDHPFFLEGYQSEVVAQLLRVMQPVELQEIRLDVQTRRHLLQVMENFYALHISDFGRLKTLPVLQEVLG